MKRLQRLINFVRDNPIAVNGKFADIDVAPIQDELDLVSNLINTVQEVLRISDRKHDAWDESKRLIAAIKSVEVNDGN